jgi:exoribonuclease-2
VISTSDKKLDIQTEKGETLNVRPKDVTVLHPGPVRTLRELQAPKGEVTAAWELLAGSTTTLPELAELAYAAYTPSTAWAVW